MKVLIIGGTGNISRGIVAALLQRNHEVVMFNRGQHPDAPPPDIQVIHGDRQDRDNFENKMRAERFDAVIDMISYNARRCRLRPESVSWTGGRIHPLFNGHDLRTAIPI